MTSPEQHLDLDELADVLADEAPLDAEEHVAGCAQCQAALDELGAAQTRVTEQLAALPAVPIPGDIADRLQAALRDAPAADEPVTATTTVTPFPTADTTDDTRANPARWLAAAAAVVVLLGGGLYGISRLGDDSGSATSASSGAGAAKDTAELNVARNNSGADYTDRATLAAAVPDLLGGKRAADAATTQEAPAATTPQRGAATKPLAGSDPLAPLRDNKGLAECLVALLPPDDPSVQPLAIDYASFRGSPAMVVVLPGSIEGKLDIFVVGPGCSRANDSVLFYTSVDRP